MSQPKLTKNELIATIEAKPKQTLEILNALLEEIKSGVFEGKTVELRGFGTFEMRIRKGKSTARNPKTGEIFETPNHGTASFRPGAELKKGTWGLRK